MLRRLSQQDGQGLLEFAVVFPLLVFFLFAVFEVGLGLNRQATLQHAVREGARSGALIDDAGDAAKARTIAQSQGLLQDADVEVCYEDLGEEGVAVDVTATYVFKPVMLSTVMGLFGASFADVDINVAGSARMERAITNPTFC